ASATIMIAPATPAVTGLSPTSGSTGGGTLVTITGTDLSGATQVLFGNTAASAFTVVSATQITATAPAQAAGSVDVRVTTPARPSATPPADSFTYVVAGSSLRTQPGFSANTLPANDDGSTGAVALGFTLNFFGTAYSTLYVNNNGNVTFGGPLSTYTPYALS